MKALAKRSVGLISDERVPMEFTPLSVTDLHSDKDKVSEFQRKLLFVSFTT